MACSRHFTSSVGQRTRVAKAEAKEPAAAFCRSLQERNCTGYLGTGLQHSRATAAAISFLNLYHKHYQTKDGPRGKASPWTREMRDKAHPIFMSNSHTSGAGDSADTDDTTEQDSSVICVNPQHYKLGLLVVTLHILQTHTYSRD